MIQLNAPQKNIFGEDFYPEINQMLFAKESSESVYKKNYPTLFDAEEMLYLVVGTDGGLFYEFIKHQKLPKHVRFVFFEHVDILSQLGLESEVSNRFDEKVSLVSHQFNLEFISTVFMNFFARKKVKLLKSMSVVDSSKNDLYDILWQQVKSSFDTLSSAIMLTQNSFQFENARLLNAADNLIPIKKLGQPLEGHTAVIIGGGPTLDDSINWIKENQDKLVIFSVGRVAHRLSEESIVPDFFVSVDPHDVSFDNSKGMFNFSEEAVLLHSYHVNPKLLGQWLGLKAYGGLKYGWKDLEVPDNIGTPGPTVVNTAFHYASSLGCSQILLSGVDFCFAKGKTHESSSNEAQLSAHLQFKNLLTLETNSGEIAETKLTLKNTKEAFEKQVLLQKSKKASMEVFSLGRDSAKMNMVDFISPEDFPLNVTKQESLSILRESLSLTKLQKIEAVEKAKNEINKEIKRFNSVEGFARSALEVLPKLFNTKTQQPVQKVKNKIDKLRKKINNMLGDDADFLMSYNFSHFSENFNPDNELNEQESAVENLTVFFESVCSATAQYKQLLELSEERTGLRLQELKGAAIKELYPFWDKYDEYGRALYWLYFNNPSNEEDQEILELSSSKFKAELTKSDTVLYSKLKKSVQSLSVLADKAKEALKHNKQQDLEYLKETALNLESQKDCIALTQLIEAMEAELSNQYETAYDRYLLVNEPVAQHIALQQALSIAIKSERYQDALMVLENLCRFSLEYMLPYAEVFDILGNTETAAQVIELYLVQKPEAYLANLKLATFYKKLGQIERSNQALQKVLDVDPENSTALFLLS